MRILRRVVSLILVCSMIPLSGCALVNGSRQNVAITTSVPDARIVVDGRPVGTTQDGVPLIVRLERSKDHIVVAQKEGYTSQHQRLDNKIDTLGVWTWSVHSFFCCP